MHTGMLLIFISITGFSTVLFLASKGKYEAYIKPLDDKEHFLKEFYPMALYLLEKISYSYQTPYDKVLVKKVRDFYGHKFAGYYFRIHWAKKLSYILLALVLLSLVGAGIGPDPVWILFSLGLAGLLFYLVDKELDEKIKVKNVSLQMDFPDFINKLTLLVNAGMTVQRAWEKIVSDNKKQTALYQELALVLAEIRVGKPEQYAYENFAERCKSREITKFVSIIVQNLKKGGEETVGALRFQAVECWELRKAVAKRLGEEASTKMLFPMMLMMAAILIIVALPAVLAISGSR